MCRLCPGHACDPAFHASSARVRAWLRERVTAILSQPSREDLLAPKRQEVPRRPEGAPAVDVRPAKPKQTSAATRARRVAQSVIQAMLRRRAEGATLRQIAEEFGLNLTTAAKRLSLAQQQAVAEGRSELEDLKRCPDCQGKKRASRERCHRCAAARALKEAA
jgi:hypothetical protein